MLAIRFLPSQTLYVNAVLITHMYICIDIYIYIYIQGVSRLVDITAGGDFLGLCDKKCLYERVSDFGRLPSYGRMKLRIEGSDY
jgi:hypothetical protein